MGKFHVGICFIAAVLLFNTGHLYLMTLAIISGIGSFWSWGIMHNYAFEQAAKRRNFTGRFYDITPQEADAVPNWITLINMIFSFIGIALLIAGGYFTYEMILR